MKFVALFSHKEFFRFCPPKQSTKIRSCLIVEKLEKIATKKWDSNADDSSFLRGLSYCIQIPSFQLLWGFKYSRCRTKTSVTRHRVAVSPLKRISRVSSLLRPFYSKALQSHGGMKSGGIYSSADTSFADFCIPLKFIKGLLSSSSSIRSFSCLADATTIAGGAFVKLSS